MCTAFSLILCMCHSHPLLLTKDDSGARVWAFFLLRIRDEESPHKCLPPGLLPMRVCHYLVDLVEWVRLAELRRGGPGWPC